MKKTERFPIFGTRLLQRGGRQVVGEERRGRGRDAHDDERIPLALRVGERVTYRAEGRTLRHYRLERGRLGGRLDQHLAADRQPDGADALGIDVGAVLEERDGAVDVAIALPAEEVRIALALALAAAVEEQHAIAVAHEHPRAELRIPRCRRTR